MAVKRPQSKQQKKYERLKRKSCYGKSWDEIRQLVYKRDGFRCRCCGISNVKLNAHHIILLRVSKTNNPRNLITLCDKCHMLIESKSLKLLKSGGHKRDVVRMTHRWLLEKRAESRKKLLVEDDVEK